jgi:hypothetical protein
MGLRSSAKGKQVNLFHAASAVADDLYTHGNNAGVGFAPDGPPGDLSIAGAIKVALAKGWSLRHDDGQNVAVLTHPKRGTMAIGGDAMREGAWAVMISEVDKWEHE